MKDNFSTQSDRYAKYRPTYPDEFFSYLNSLVPKRQAAWDCGTGNGQVAAELARTFEQVFATDISSAQIEQAVQLPNITYSVQPAEQTSFPDATFDLVVVAQAIHWFDFPKFYEEVRRTVKSNGIIGVIGYGKISVTDQIDRRITNFYQEVIGPYWDKERRYINENYATIPFPFPEIPAPELAITLDWSFDHLIGYLSTWSAVKHFIKANRYNPVDALAEELREFWGNEATKVVHFPMLIRVGRVVKK
jgi:ubiquinone/menaquinone biosynthesis C-methylase UbiE